jgi:proteasome alpha subunit
MTEEPYRWLEAIQNRREYIEDQLTPGLPVVALSAQPGILLAGFKTSTPKVFEIYDNLALGTLGHPADIEKVRQTAIDAAHLEGFARSAQDVSARRLVSYNLAPALKAAFEQIFSAPLLFRGILAELGETPEGDALWTVDYDGSFSAQTGSALGHGVVLSGPRQVARDWTQATQVLEHDSLKSATISALRMLLWAKLRGTKDQGIEFNDTPTELGALREKLGTDQIDFALLDRSLLGRPISYRVPTKEELGL